MNLVFYLADQLLRRCQSADNQVQAFQNQATKVFFFFFFFFFFFLSVVEVVQIQPFVRLSLRYLISLD
jgi:hypothetical protein